jgi:hypothetical protein
LNSGVNDRRRRGCFRSMVSMMNILPSGAEPLMVNVRQTGGSPVARAEVGLPDTFTPHSLRKWYISRSLAAGRNPAAVAEVAGHSETVMMRHYARMTQSDAQTMRGQSLMGLAKTPHAVDETTWGSCVRGRGIEPRGTAVIRRAVSTARLAPGARACRSALMRTRRMQSRDVACSPCSTSRWSLNLAGLGAVRLPPRAGQAPFRSVDDERSVRSGTLPPNRVSG